MEGFLDRVGVLGLSTREARTPGGGSEPNPAEWPLTYDSFIPEQERLREVLTSTGNGHFCARGAPSGLTWTKATIRAPIAHGCNNRETTIIGGGPVPNEDLVNFPNWLVLKLRIGGDEPINLKNVELLSYRHEVDFRKATVKRRLRFRDRRGRETTLVQQAFRQHGRHAPGSPGVDHHG